MTERMHDLGLQVTALRIMADYAAKAYDIARAELEQQMRRGDRITAYDPTEDVKLSAITLTDPKKTVRVNEPELTPWMVENYPELTESVSEVVATPKQVSALLFEHAPHLLTQRKRVKPEAMIELKAACVALGYVMGPGGEADVPGVSVETPDPRVQCRPTAEAEARVLALLRSGQLEIDGTVRPMIEGAA